MSLARPDSMVATAPLGGGTAVSIAVGCICALLPLGELVCWGNNEFGQLGDMRTTNQPSAVAAASVCD